MITKTIKYTDYNGVERTEEHCFHLSKIERVRLDSKYPGGIEKWIEVQSKNSTQYELLSLIEEIIQTAHGVKSDDGIRFIKSTENTNSFVESEAYSEFVIGLLSGENAVEKVTDFITRVIGENA